MKQIITKLFIFSALLAVSSESAFAQKIFALTQDNQLIAFNATAPNVFTQPSLLVTGMATGEELVGFDARPRTGELYTLGYNSSTAMGRLYKLNPLTGTLLAIGAANFSITLGTAANNVAFDFNPTVDRIRVISTTGKNYRLHPDLGTIVATDTDVSYGAGDANVGIVPTIGQIAYSNSYVAATKTALYYLDEGNNSFGTAFVATNPNNGQIKTIGNTGLTLNPADKTVDMDVAFNGTSNTIYLAANIANSTADALYTINPANGSAALVGAIGATPTAVKDIAVAIDRTVPPLAGRLAFALTTHAAPRLVSFDLQNPSVIRTDVAIGGLKAGQTLAAMDMRPQDNKLYALGVATDTFTTIYTVNDTTGAMTIFADSVRLDVGGNPNIGFDFNPVANRLRIVSAASGKNYRLNLTTTPITVIQDTTLSYKSTDINVGRTPFVGSVAYTNSFVGATATKMFDIDEKTGSFLQQNTPNGGFLITIGSTGLVFDTLDYSVDIDIATGGTSALPTNIGYLTANVLGGNNYDNLYTLDVATGAATLVGRIGNGLGIRDLAAKIGGVIVGNEELTLNDLEARYTPNPSSGRLQISFDNNTSSAVEISVFDLNGRLIERQNFRNTDRNFRHELDLSQQEAGIYVVRLRTEQGFSVQKIVKF